MAESSQLNNYPNNFMSDAGHKKQVVVIEQEAYLARIICRGLKKAGFEVHHLSNGEAGLKDLQDRIPDYLVVASEMEPMGGEEFCRRLQTEHPDRAFPVFVMSDSAEDKFSKWSHWFSNFRMVEKPVSLRFIIDHIEQHQGQAA